MKLLLGKWSGKIYETIDVPSQCRNSIFECCIPFDGSMDEDQLAYLRTKSKIDCYCCLGKSSSKEGGI